MNAPKLTLSQSIEAMKSFFMADRTKQTAILVGTWILLGLGFYVLCIAFQVLYVSCVMTFGKWLGVVVYIVLSLGFVFLLEFMSKPVVVRVSPRPLYSVK